MSKGSDVGIGGVLLRVALLLAVAAPALAHPDEQDARGDVVQGDQRPRKTVTLTGVQFSPDGLLTANVVNRTGQLVRKVRLLIRYDWIWADERNPGEHSPGRSVYHEVDADIPAFGAVPIRFTPSPPLPTRSDGRFVPSVEVARYTQVRYEKR